MTRLSGKKSYSHNLSSTATLRTPTRVGPSATQHLSRTQYQMKKDITNSLAQGMDFWATVEAEIRQLVASVLHAKPVWYVC
jgi:hypothetical protein